MISQESLRSILNYNPDDGKFIWKVRASHRIRIGAEAGCVGKNGYRYITINGERLLAHRLAVVYMTGRWPSCHVDHVNGCSADNRWCNLRLATVSQNLGNQGPHRDNKSGAKGIHFDYRRRKWVARRSIYIERRRDSRSCGDASRRLYGEFARID